MLFDLGPKESRADLFGRDEELGEVDRFLKGPSRLLVIYGIRRIGKTSVLKAALNESGIPYCYIDAKGLEGDLSVRRLYGLISRCLGEVGVRFRLESVLRRVARSLRGVHVFGSGVDFSIDVEWNRVYLTDLLGKISDNVDKFVLAIDEAQWLRLLRGHGKVNMALVLAYVYDNLSNIKVILTGSEVGLLHDFIGFNDPRSPLYGRVMDELTLKPFDRNRSMEFLRLGFRQCGVDVGEDEIAEVVDRLDGVVGWLTYYGYMRAIKGIKPVEIYNEALALINNELKSLLGRSRYYELILEALARGRSRFSEVRDYVSTRLGRYVQPTEVSRSLNNLVKLGVVRRSSHGVYEVVDPMVKAMFGQPVK
jgi:AAA+ ATPase superfamily predicted ATPase